MLIRAQFFCSHPAGRDRAVFPTEQVFVVPDVVAVAMAPSTVVAMSSMAIPRSRPQVVVIVLVVRVQVVRLQWPLNALVFT